MSCAPPGKSPAWVHLVKDGERVEVEVDEHGTGEVEWRRRRCSASSGAKGRFQCEVTFADGTRPDFIETYDRESFEREWRVAAQGAKKKEAPPEQEGQGEGEGGGGREGGRRRARARGAAAKGDRRSSRA